MKHKLISLILPASILYIHAFAQPTITSFIPTSGHIGIRVTIKGTNFNSAPANNIVYFGAVRAAVAAASDTSLTVTVPAGATYQPISVLNTVSGKIAYSSQPFIVTFNGGGFIPNSFAGKVDFKTGGGPQSVCEGDLDRDGKPDLIVANNTSQTISVYINTGTNEVISFASKKDYSTIGYPSGISVADLNGDGMLDIAVATSDKISVFRNASSIGNLVFAARVDIGTIDNAEGVSIGDLDGNGRADLVVLDGYNDKVSIFRNLSAKGTISFAPKIDFNSGGGGIRDVSIGDLNGDSKPDIAVASAGVYDFWSGYLDGMAVTILKNISIIDSISFADAVIVSETSYPAGVAIGDLDADGKPDLAVADWGLLDNPIPSG